MGMIEQAQADIKRIRTDPNGFTKLITFKSPDGRKTASIYGMFSKIHMATDTEGNLVNSKKGNISVSESALTDAGYPTRDVDNKCILKDHLITVLDSTGILYNAIIREVFPDETVGLTVCLLGDYE